MIKDGTSLAGSALDGVGWRGGGATTTGGCVTVDTAAGGMTTGAGGMHRLQRSMAPQHDYQEEHARDKTDKKVNTERISYSFSRAGVLGLHHPRQFLRIPIRQPDAAVRFRVPDAPGLRRSVDPIMLFRERDPNHPDRVVRTGLNNGLLIGRVRVPEEVRIVVKGGVAFHTLDLPVP